MNDKLKKACLLGIVIVMLVVGMFPQTAFTEDKATMRLARTIYAMAGRESLETKLAIGSLVMNRVDSGEYPDTLWGVLKEKHQFPSGTRYDEESLKAAHAVLGGKRTLPKEYVCWQLAENEYTEATKGGRQIGGYVFYTE